PPRRRFAAGADSRRRRGDAVGRARGHRRAASAEEQEVGVGGGQRARRRRRRHRHHRRRGRDPAAAGASRLARAGGRSSMTSRALVVAALLAAGCRAAPTTVRVTLTAASGFAADDLQLDVYDRQGRIVSNSDLGSSTRLPGDAVVELSPDAGEARVNASGWTDGAMMGDAAGRVPVIAGMEMPLALRLGPSLPDADGDGVPDVIDNCPNTPNADQADSDGGA